jgi:Phosphoglucomutase/phosphomannomutase, alpha/beta/alpha domain I
VSSAIGSEPVPSIAPLAGKPAPKEILVDVGRLEREYFERRPDLGGPKQMVSFGTSGHRGSPLRGTFTEAHILAITQAICDYRRSQGTDGPLYMGKDTHAVSAAESFKDRSHLDAIVSKAEKIVGNALNSSNVRSGLT